MADNKSQMALRTPTTIGERIRFIREFQGLTQAEFAKIVGFKSQGSMSAAESGHKDYQLHIAHAHVICDRYGATLDFIYRGVHDRIPRPMRDAWLARQGS